MNPTRRQRFEAIFAAHYGDVHRYALRRAEPPLAEEIVNETFLVAWRRFDDVPAEPLPWLYATAAHVLANRRREATRHARRTSAAAAEPPATARDPAERLAERDAALRAFTALSEPDREALRLVAWERLSLADAASAAGVTRPAFAMRVHRARRRLAAHLREQDADFDLALSPRSSLMPDALTRLREADPAAHVDTTPARRRPARDPRDAARARSAAARRGSSSPPPPSPPPRWSRFAALPGTENAPGPIRESLAERAFAATAPTPDFITYTETTTVQTGMPKLESRDTLRQWQYRDRMHNFMDTVQPRGTWTYEHDQNATTIPHADANDKGGRSSRSPTRPTRAGTRRNSTRASRSASRPSSSASASRSATRQDLGETTFNGKPAHAYQVDPRQAAPAGRRATYYVDPQTALPLGSKIELADLQAEAVDGKLDAGRAGGHGSRSSRPSTATSTSSRRPRTSSSSTRRTSTRPTRLRAVQGPGATPASPPSTSSGGTSCQPLAQQGGMVVGVANAEGADEDPPRLLAHHRVPQRARVPVPAHGVPGPRRRVLRRRHAASRPAAPAWRPDRSRCR